MTIGVQNLSCMESLPRTRAFGPQKDAWLRFKDFCNFHGIQQHRTDLNEGNQTNTSTLKFHPLITFCILIPRLSVRFYLRCLPFQSRRGFSGFCLAESFSKREMPSLVWLKPTEMSGNTFIRSPLRHPCQCLTRYSKIIAA